jgi:TonB-linked SusC/RagA family outer membrane protein
MKRFLILCFLMAAFVNAFSQVTVTGKVTDSSAEPLFGVSVLIKGTTIGVITDIRGNYSIPNVPEDATIQFSFIGMKTREIEVNGMNTIDVKLIEDRIGLEEVVAVGYSVQKRINMTGAVDAVRGDELKKVNVANVSNSIGGQVSGIVTRQLSGEPGNDAADIFLRGTKPLVLVDGIEREWDKLNLLDIETVTVLKDATAVAPFGLKGANGVILITTRRGKQGKVSLTYNSEYGWQKPTNTPDFMNSADGLRLRNTALIMDGLGSAVFSDTLISLYETGSDEYPNTDWIKNYLHTSNKLRQNLTITGGSETVQAYISIGYTNQGNMFGDKHSYDRYNIASNLDMRVTKTTSVSLDMNLISDKEENSYGSAETQMLDLYRLRAIEPDIYSNGLPAYQSSIGWSMYGKINGDKKYITKKDYQNLGLSIKQELPFIKGLSVRTNLNIDKYFLDNKSWVVPFISYQLNATTGEYDEDNAWLRSKPTLGQNSTIRTFYTTQGFINYDNQFGKHGLQALAVYERRWGGQRGYAASRINYNIAIPELDMGSPNKEDQSNSGSSTESGQDGFIFRTSYNFNHKYLIEMAGRYDRTSKYASDRRSAFFPSASIGWRISEEGFVKDNLSAINNLKLRASYGKSGRPVGGEFAYLSKYLVEDSYVWGSYLNGLQEQGVYEGSEPNIFLTWETVWKANLGFDLNMWNGLFGMTADVYRDYRSDKILAPNAIVPIEYGISLSDENAGKEERYGIDLSLSNLTKIGSDFTFSNHFVFGFTRNKQLEIREAPGTYNLPELRETGRPSDQIFGYRAAGLFADQEDIDNWAYQGSSVLPGDVKYIDINGDGKINAEDQVVIGKARIPEIMYGYNMGLSYKNIDVRLFFQGTGNSNFYMGWGSPNSSQGERGVRFPFENDKPLKDHINSWTTDNPDPNAPYPRLSTSNRTQNYLRSDYWVRNSAYLRLKTIDVGYNFNPELTRKVFMDNIRAYLNIYNVWTIYSQMPKDFDPENQSYNTYPQQFITTLGLNITF